MEKDNLAPPVQLAIIRIESNLRRIDGMRSEIRSITRSLFLMEDELSQSLNDLRRLYRELNSKEEA